MNNFFNLFKRTKSSTPSLKSLHNECEENNFRKIWLPEQRETPIMPTWILNQAQSPHANFYFWCKKSLWTLEEAAILSGKIDPRCTTIEVISRELDAYFENTYSGKLDLDFPSTEFRNILACYNMLLHLKTNGLLEQEVCSPKNILSLLKKNGINFPNIELFLSIEANENLVSTSLGNMKGNVLNEKIAELLPEHIEKTGSQAKAIKAICDTLAKKHPEVATRINKGGYKSIEVGFFDWRRTNKNKTSSKE